jgi:hypothetical protein
MGAAFAVKPRSLNLTILEGEADSTGNEQGWA